MFLPSRVISPEAGASTRARARSRVDFPQPLGPMMAVKVPWGISTLSSVEMVR
ncbi:hypothetical protein Cocul_02052 [Corynebacterium oculi]|uniref:Uncharacterized protein n=1 Tax=Corynebacterium oculi TaxID=1544416 RepID=A0A0Q0YKS7_9CORY|nr:hypothetical protein Cocul_02052 [Corynebacterium oculi]